MAMPIDLVLVRHGQSEANMVQKRIVEAPVDFYDRHDSLMRLSALGIDQAVQTGAWLRQEFPSGFDAHYVSSLARTMETAGHLTLGGSWNVDDKWRERDWGEFNAVSNPEESELYKASAKLKGQSKWYWCPAGGESLASGVSLRIRDILGTLHREQDGKRVIAVTHGETIEVARVILERLLPMEWEDQEKDENYKLSNCQVLHYSRRNPLTNEISKRLEWRRSVCAWDESKSWQDGKWTRFERRAFSDVDLLSFVELNPRLLTD